jgi:AraC-like DNA-binding protein
MSRATLARQFQKKLGRSATDLLTEIRMTLAANELKKSSMSSSSVAEAVGYQSEAAFQRAFKNHMGMTPAQWRKTQEIPSADLFAVPLSESGNIAHCKLAGATRRRRQALLSGQPKALNWTEHQPLADLLHHS